MKKVVTGFVVEEDGEDLTVIEPVLIEGSLGLWQKNMEEISQLEVCDI